MRRKQRNIAATLLAVLLMLLTMFTVSAQSNTITPTLKKVGYGIKDSSGTVNVYEQAFLIKSGAVNVHGGIAICFDTGKPAAKSGTTYQYIGLAQNQTGSYSAKQAYNCMLAAESIITKSKYNSLTNEMKAAAIHRAVSKYKEYGSGVTGGAFSGSADIKCTTAQATLMVQLQTEIVKAAKALNKELPSTAAQTGTISATKTGGDYFSGSNYVLAVYKLSESGVTASVDASGTNISGVQASVSGTTLTVSVPTANLNGSGMLAVTTQISGTKGHVDVYGADMQVLFAFNAHRRFVADACVTEDGGYLAQCIFGDAQADISPCGTGTSTRLAQRYFRGLIGLEETFVQKSVCGGAFHAKGLRETTLGGVPAIVPYVSCSDVHITGFNHLIVEENDKLKNGFVSW